MTEFEQELLISDLRDDIESLNEKLRAERKRATNAEYFILAYYNMLGPIGRDVVKMWNDKNVQRVHFSWGPDAFTEMDGEARAQFILDIEKLPMREVHFDDNDAVVDGPPRTKRPKQSLDEFVATSRFDVV